MLRKKANHKLVDVSTVAKDKIIILHNLIMDTKGNDVPDWDNPNRYTCELYRHHVRTIRRAQRQNVKQRLEYPSGAGSSFGHGHAGHGKTLGSVTEKEYDAWQRRRASKESFPILKDDLKYITWKRDFEAELKVQKLDCAIAPDFDPHAMRDSYDIKLYEQ